MFVKYPYGWCGDNGANFVKSVRNEKSSLRIFLTYIRDSKLHGRLATKRDFMVQVLHRDYARGWRSVWFAGLRYSGFVVVTGRNHEGFIYDIGPRALDVGI